MNFRFTAILFGTVFALGVVLLLVSFFGDDTPPTDLLAEELAAFKASDIDTLEIERGNGARIKIERVNKDRNLWNVVEPYTARADAAVVGEVVSTLLKAKPTAYSELTSNPALHGLQPPDAVLRVTLRAGERASTINLGDVTIGGSDAVAFVTTSAQPKRPMAVPRGSVDALFRDTTGSGKAMDLAKTAADFRTRSVFATDTRGAGEDVTAVTLSAKGKVLSLERSGGGWKFVTPQGWGQADSTGDMAGAPGTFTGVSRLLGTLTNMQAASSGDFVESPTPQQLTDAGLNDGNADRVKVEIRTREGDTITAFIGKGEAASPAPPAPPGMPPASGKRWVQVVGQPGIMRATAGDLSGLAAVVENPDSLRDRTLLALDAGRIDALDIGGAVKLRKTGVGIGTWKMYGNPSAGDPTPASGVDRILAVLTERRIIKSFPAPNEANFAGGIEVKVWADGFEAVTDPKADPKAEPKMKGKPVTLTFGKKEGDAVHVKRVSTDGAAPEYFLLPEKIKLPPGGDTADLLATVNKSRLELLDPALKTFAATGVSKLTATGAANYELDRDDAASASAGPGQSAWKFAKPDDRKGQLADGPTVNDMLAVLATTQSVTRFINENPDAAKLAEYGLGPVPRLKVVVALKDVLPEEKERVYEFGKETADANYVYARQAGRAAVFTLPKFLYDRFAAADLQDRSIFRFDPNQVTAIKLKGWKAVTGAYLELKFEKNKDGNWTVTQGPNGYAVDPAKVAAFLSMLNRSRVKEFVKGPATPAMGFGDEKEHLGITLTIPNQPAVELHVWSLTDGGASYFAGTTLRPTPEPVVKLDATTFKPYKDSPASFAK